jgi:hypothetical protein
MVGRKSLVVAWVLALFLLSAAAAAADDPTVYITRTGKKYHVVSCSYLRKSSIPIALSQALARGYGPCSRCNPPTEVTLRVPSASETSCSCDQLELLPQKAVGGMVRTPDARLRGPDSMLVETYVIRRGDAGSSL